MPTVPSFSQTNGNNTDAGGWPFDPRKFLSTVSTVLKLRLAFTVVKLRLRGHHTSQLFREFSPGLYHKSMTPTA